MPETIQEVADRLRRAADRYRNGGDMNSATLLEQAAQRADSADGVEEALEIENSAMGGATDSDAGGSWFSRLLRWFRGRRYSDDS